MGRFRFIRRALKQVRIQSVLASALRTPGVKINREEYLKKMLEPYYPDVTMRTVIRYNPAKAGVPRHMINRIARREINYETARVTAASVVSTIPGGPAAIAAAIADMTAYFVFLLRVMQKLAYLYGFAEFRINADGADPETMSTIILFLGVMFGVHGSTDTLKKMTNIISRSVSKSLSKKAFTTSLVYPLVNAILTAVGLRMTRQLFADLLAAVVPVAGAAFAGFLTWVLFHPCCKRLRRQLMEDNISDPAFYRQNAE